MKRRSLATALACTACFLAWASAAWAHAIVSPSIAPAKADQQFTLSVPTEKEGEATTKIELTVPSGFDVDSFEPVAAPWKRQVRATGSGQEAVVQKVTWTGGRTPAGEDAVFRFNAAASAAKTYRFVVRQTYSDGTVVDWSGTESSDTPAPLVRVVSSLGGGDGSSTLTVVALVVGGVGLLVGIVALVGGRRELA